MLRDALALVLRLPLILVLEVPDEETLLLTVVELPVVLVDLEETADWEEDALVLLCPDADVLLPLALCVTERTDLAAELVLVVVVLVTAEASLASLSSLAFAVLPEAAPDADLVFAIMSALRSVKECSG